MNSMEKPPKALSIISFVSGILGFLCLAAVVYLRSSGIWCLAACVIFSVAGLVLSAVSLKKPDGIKAMSLAGMIVSITTLALLLILVTLIAALFIFFSDVIRAISGLGQIG